MSYEEKYIKFIEDAYILKKESGGHINLFKNQTNGRTVLKLFDDLTKGIPTDKIMFDEGIWIESAKTGAIIWGDKYMGKGFKYDYCSMYPSVMIKQDTNIFPIKRGKFKTLTQDEFITQNLSEIAIYRCVIARELKFSKLFRWNSKNFYTNVDLIMAKELGLKTTIIKDRQPNCLHYESSDCINGSEIFGKYINLLFPLKYKKIPRAKQFLTMLWGVLGQRSDLGYKILREDSSLLDINSLNFQQRDGNIYKTNYARTIPFILAYGREKITNTMKPFLENIVRCATDGFISTVKIDFPLGDNIGDLKYEGYCSKCVVHNANRVDGEFN